MPADASRMPGEGSRFLPEQLGATLTEILDARVQNPGGIRGINILGDSDDADLIDRPTCPLAGDDNAGTDLLNVGLETSRPAVVCITAVLIVHGYHSAI